MPCPREPAPRVTAPGTSSASPITPSTAAAWRCAIRPAGSSSASSTTPGASSRSAPATRCLLMSIIDPVHPPEELMLQWHTSGGWTHRAYWGENVIDWGTDGTPERLQMGDLPPSGKWVRLEVPVAKLKLAPGTVIDGWAFTQHGGTVYWDKAGIETRPRRTGSFTIPSRPGFGPQRVGGGAGLARRT